MRPGGLRSLSSALKAAKLDITAIQETRWPGQNLLTSKDYKFYYSGKKDGPRKFGTGFMVFGKSRNAVLGFNPVDEWICILRIRGKFFNYTLSNVHAPTEEKEGGDKDIFYDKLVGVYDPEPNRDIKIVLGEFNAKIGR